MEPVIVYPVRSFTNFSTDGSGGGVFGDAVMLRPGTTVKTFVETTSSGLADYFQVWCGACRASSSEEMKMKVLL